MHTLSSRLLFLLAKIGAWLIMIFALGALFYSLMFSLIFGGPTGSDGSYDPHIAENLLDNLPPVLFWIMIIYVFFQIFRITQHVQKGHAFSWKTHRRFLKMGWAILIVEAIMGIAEIILMSMGASISTVYEEGRFMTIFLSTLNVHFSVLIVALGLGNLLAARVIREGIELHEQATAPLV